MTATIDVNAYAGGWPYWRLDERSPRDVAELGLSAGIDKVLVCSTRAVFLDAGEGNAEVFEDARGVPNVLIAAVFNPRGGPRAVDQVAGYAERGAVAIRLFPQHHRYRLSAEPFVREGLDEAARLGLPVILSSRLVMNWGLPTYDPFEACPIISATPHVRYVLSGVNYGAELATARSIMRQFSNVSIESSCLQGFRTVPLLLQEFGAERVLFGAGLPIQYPACGLAKLEDPALTEADLALIRGANMERLIRGPQAVE